MADQLNAKGGDFRFEVTGYDNKLNPQESIVQLQKAIDAGARIVIQGNGSVGRRGPYRLCQQVQRPQSR